MIGNRHHGHEFAQSSCGRGASCARSGVSGVEDHGLAVRVGGAVHGLVGEFAFGDSAKVNSPCGSEPVVYVLIWLA